MSYEATVQAWQSFAVHKELAATRRIVLLALAECHNKTTGRCDPSLDELVRMTGMKRNTIPPSIRDLESAGLLSVTRAHGTKSSYDLHLTSTENGTSTEISTSTENGQNQYRKGYSHLNQEEPGIDSVIPPNPPRRDDGELFARFWAAYPLKRSKGTAERAFAKLKPNEPLLAEILVGLERAKTSDPRFTGGEYIPHPATWLNAKGWQDEAAPGNPKPATSSAYGQQPRQAHSNRNGAHHATPTRPDNSAPGKIARAIAARDAARQPPTTGGGYAGDDCIELGSSDYRAVAH